MAIQSLNFLILPIFIIISFDQVSLSWGTALDNNKGVIPHGNGNFFANINIKKEHLEHMKNFFKELCEKFYSSPNMKDGFDDYYEDIGAQMYEEYAEDFVEAMEEIFEDLTDIFDESESFDELGEKLIWYFEKNWSSGSSYFHELVNEVLEFFKNLDNSKNHIDEWEFNFTALYEEIQNDFEELASGMKEYFGELFKNISKCHNQPDLPGCNGNMGNASNDPDDPSNGGELGGFSNGSIGNSSNGSFGNNSNESTGNSSNGSIGGNLNGSGGNSSNGSNGDDSNGTFGNGSNGSTGSGSNGSSGGGSGENTSDDVDSNIGGASNPDESFFDSTLGKTTIIVVLSVMALMVLCLTFYCCLHKLPCVGGKKGNKNGAFFSKSKKQKPTPFTIHLEPCFSDFQNDSCREFDGKHNLDKTTPKLFYV